MKKINILLAIALMAVIYSCGNGGQGSNEQNADSLATAEQVDKKNAEQVEPQITLTVKSGEVIKFGLASKADNTPIRIVSGERDTSFVIGLNNKNIYSKGSQSFVSIEYLSGATTMTIHGKVKEFDCANNGDKLTAVDFSKTTYLTYIELHNNDLSSLDVSTNTALTYLGCDGNYGLSSLDVSKNTALEYLRCEGKITTLDISKCTALKELICSNCELTDLDISKNLALIRLHCYGNKLTSLDASKNIALKELFCSDNPIKTLDISNNSALTSLACEHCSLTSLDISNNTALENLTVGNEGLINVNISNNNKALKEIYVGEDFSYEIFYKNLPDRKGLEPGIIRFEGMTDRETTDKKINWKIIEMELGDI